MVTGTQLTPEPLYFEVKYGLLLFLLSHILSLQLVVKPFLYFCQDEDEFPDLATGGGVQRSKQLESTPAQTQTQPKLPKNLVRKCR